MKKWVVYNKRADFKKIGNDFGIDQVIARIIRNRDIIEEKDVDKFLNGDLNQLYSPHQMKDMDKAVLLLQEKIQQKKPIRIIGDYDIDGVQATYILLKGLKRAGAIATAAIPDRMKDGYGVNENLITQAKTDGADTIITCDNGIAAIDAINYGKELGMTVIVTDHHDIPYIEENEQRTYLESKADAIVNPKQKECEYPFKGICGAVVAWKLVLALYEAMDIPAEEGMEFLENAAFATVGDVMDLRDENRIIVKYGLEQMRHTKNRGLHALMMQKNIEPERLSAYHLGFVLGPCLNASGRLDTAKRSLALLLEQDAAKAVELAAELADLNEERKNMTTKGIEEAKIQILNNGWEQDKVMVVYLPNLHESLAGIVAGRIREQYYKPVFVLTKSEEGVKGSGRSIDTYSMYEELCKCREMLTKFGGHPMAAGVSMEEASVDKFRRLLNENCTLGEEDFVEKVHIDVPMPMGYVSQRLISQFKVLEPFGKGNTKPLFADRNIQVLESRVLGKNQNVLKLKLADVQGMHYTGIYFGEAAKMQEELRSKSEIAVLYYPEVNSYMGREEIQYVISGVC